MTDNKEVSQEKQCDINGVVQSFYCVDEVKHSEKCYYQCIICQGI